MNSNTLLLKPHLFPASKAKMSEGIPVFGRLVPPKFATANEGASTRRDIPPWRDGATGAARSPPGLARHVRKQMP